MAEFTWMSETELRRFVDKGINEMIIDPQGGRKRVTLDKTPILVAVTRSDGKVGSTHLCSPFFGPPPPGYEEMKQHGPVRNPDYRWNVVYDHAEPGRTTTTLRTNLKSPVYPPGLQITQTAIIEPNKWTLETVHTNTNLNPDEAGLPVSSAEHCYWDAPEGLEGFEVNNEPIAGGDFSVARFIPLYETNIIAIPGKPKITFTQRGYSTAAIWLGKGDRRYVCLEPTEFDPESTNPAEQFGGESTLILPGQSRLTEFSISI